MKRGVFARAWGKAQRTLAQHFLRTPLHIDPEFRAVSFTFDDFPASASNAAKLLEEAGVRGTFYACYGLAGKDSPSGVCASEAEIDDIASRGHEIGCHTYDHVNFSYTKTRTCERSSADNRKAAKAHGQQLEHFAYPQGGLSVGGKAFVRREYRTARTTRPGINRGVADAHGLLGTSVYEHKPRAGLLALIDEVAASGGWLIFYSHDVANDPSPYGITVETLKALIDHCRANNVAILSVGEAQRRASDTK